MMNFKQQMEWLEDKITQLEDEKSSGEDYLARMKSRIARESQLVILEQLDIDIKALKQIRNGYEKANKDSVILSWTEYPEGMGK